MAVVSRAWMIEPIEFHRHFESLLAGPDGLVSVRDEAVRVWDGSDSVVRSYIELLVVAGPEEWARACDETHLVEWYRVLMGPHLIPARPYRSPETLRRELPVLGWHATEARRVARGRELLTLAERHLDDRCLEPLRLRFGWGHKGWLDNDDITSSLHRLQRLERSVFRGHQDLVPVVEDAFEVLEAAATKPDHVMIAITE